MRAKLIFGCAAPFLLWLAFWLVREGWRMVHFAWYDCIGYPWLSAHIFVGGLAFGYAGCFVAFCTCVAVFVSFGVSPNGER